MEKLPENEIKINNNTNEQEEKAEDEIYGKDCKI